MVRPRKRGGRGGRERDEREKGKDNNDHILVSVWEQLHVLQGRWKVEKDGQAKKEEVYKSVQAS